MKCSRNNQWTQRLLGSFLVGIILVMLLQQLLPFKLSNVLDVSHNVKKLKHFLHREVLSSSTSSTTQVSSCNEVDFMN